MAASRGPDFPFSADATLLASLETAPRASNHRDNEANSSGALPTYLHSAVVDDEAKKTPRVGDKDARSAPVLQRDGADAYDML